MNNNNYIGRMHRKFESVLNYYAAKMYKTVAKAENVLALETKEHFRTPPAAADMHAIANGTPWGEEYGNIWLSCEITVPEEADGKLLGAIPDVNAAEILCFKDGKPVGLINSKNRFIGGEHSAMIISKCAKAGEKYTLAFECYAGHTCFGCSPYESYMRDENVIEEKEFKKKFNGINIVVLDQVINDFVFDVATVLQISRLPAENYTAMKAHQCLSDAFPYLIQDVRCATEDEIHESCAKVSECLAPALEKGEGDRSRGYVAVIGHSHMDTAWLWPVS